MTTDQSRDAASAKVSPNPRPVIFVVGPTTSGKSANALRWAVETGGDIVNADSLQVYRDLNLGTAKPSSEDFQTAPHHLFNIVDAGKTFNAGDYRRSALECLAKLQSGPSTTGETAPIFVVGGSGFYIQALIKGMFDAPAASLEVQATLRARMIVEGPQALHQELLAKDPESAAHVHFNDSYRIQRALEIFEATGRPASQIKKDFRSDAFPYPFSTIGLTCDREMLRERVVARTKAMIESGLVHEVKTLVAQGWAAWSPLQSVGYRECLSFLAGEISEGELPTLITTHTMQLAKRQTTWFKRDSTILWTDKTSDLSWAEAAAMIIK